jgi:AraC-like DNA-binding protein
VDAIQQRAGAEAFDAGSVGREHVYEAWREATAPVYRTTAWGQRDEFDAAIRAYNLDGMVVTKVRFAASRFERSERMLADESASCITIQQYTSGGIRGRVGDHDLHMAPDRISIHDFAVPYEGHATASEVLGVSIPRDLVRRAERIRTRSPMFSFPLSSASGSMLACALDVLWTQLESGRLDEPATAASGFLGLLDGLLDPATQALPDEDLLCGMERHLRERLHDPNVGVDDLRAAFHRSRSTIYRLFEPHGGVATFLRDERLRGCDAALVRASPGSGLVSQIAARHGFYDAPQFTRAFRRSYGVAPSDLLHHAGATAERAPQPTTSAPATQIRSWLEAL